MRLSMLLIMRGEALNGALGGNLMQLCNHLAHAAIHGEAVHCGT